MLVFDLDHITSAHYSSKQFASSFTTLIMLFQEHYPLVLRKILIIRAPEMARIAFNSMTPFLSEATQKLIEIPSEEDWKMALSEYVVSCCCWDNMEILNQNSSWNQNYYQNSDLSESNFLILKSELFSEFWHS